MGLVQDGDFPSSTKARQSSREHKEPGLKKGLCRIVWVLELWWKIDTMESGRENTSSISKALQWNLLCTTRRKCLDCPLAAEAQAWRFQLLYEWPITVVYFKWTLGIHLFTRLLATALYNEMHCEYRVSFGQQFANFCDEQCPMIVFVKFQGNSSVPTLVSRYWILQGFSLLYDVKSWSGKCRIAQNQTGVQKKCTLFCFSLLACQ